MFAPGIGRLFVLLAVCATSLARLCAESPTPPSLPIPSTQLGKKAFESTATELRRPSREEIARHHDQLFMPLQGEAAAISPDGRHVAYSVRSGNEVSIIIRPLPLDSTCAARLVVASDESTAPSKIFQSKQARVTWLRWSTNDRLIAQINAGKIMGTDVDGKNARVLRIAQAAPTSVSRKSRFEMISTPLNSAEAVWPDDPRKIVIRTERLTNLEGDIEHAYALLDSYDGATTSLSKEKAEAAIKSSSSLLRAAWPDARVTLQNNLPGMKIDIVASDPTARLFIYTAQHLADAGELGLLDRSTNTVATLTRRSTNDGTIAPHVTSVVDLTTPDGVRLACSITLPKHPRTKLAPLVVICPSKPGERMLLDYRPEIQALADAGFAIAEVEGYGASHHERVKIDDTDAPKQLATLFRLINHLTENFSVNPKSVALIGEAHGAQLALRAIQARPKQFRGVVFIDPWTYSMNWTDAADTRAKADRNLERPALLFSFRKKRGNHEGALQRNGLPVTTHYLEKIYDRQSMGEVRPVFILITEFFYEHLYDYTASIGPTKFLEDPPEEPPQANPPAAPES
ncbi:alpha/beta hydrolase family protein [Oleiharenicola lentus]|uniref:alpha/beta hydrolase family protein n=1 Tax=Oleiharenicola lentus TaxID=2508720 RepID=UPI003F67E37A